MLENINDIEDKVEEMGFLPFFSCGIRGFSIEEMTPSHLWFSHDEDGPWEWKGPIIDHGRCVYGKFFRRKAVFISKEWFPHFVNFRRSLYNKGDTGYKRRRIYESLAYSQPGIGLSDIFPDDDRTALDDIILQTVEQENSTTIKDLRHLLGIGFSRRRQPGDLVDLTAGDVPGCAVHRRQKVFSLSLDTILARLQMQTRLVISGFEYNRDRSGNAYGWGIARYAAPENIYGHGFIHSCSDVPPEQSLRLIINHLTRILPAASETQIFKLVM